MQYPGIERFFARVFKLCVVGKVTRSNFMVDPLLELVVVLRKLLNQRMYALGFLQLFINPVFC